MHNWRAELGVTALFIEPGSESGYIESFSSELRDRLLNGEFFYTLKEAQILVANWRRLYNGLRPHSSRGRRAPAPEMIVLPGFSLEDYALPILSQGTTLSLS